MKPVPANNLSGDSAKARIVMIYGESGVGKSLNSIPKKEDIKAGERVLYVQVEGNNPIPELKALGYAIDHIDVIQYAGSTWDEWREFVNNAKDIAKTYRYMVIDSFTQLMELTFNEIIEETKDKRRAGDSSKNKSAVTFSLGDEVKAEMADYGAVGQHMIRFFNSLDVYKALGVHIIMTAKLDEDAKKTFVKRPMIVGQFFSNKLPYYVDALGYVEAKPLTTDGKYQIPRVRFYSKDGSFQAKMRAADQTNAYKVYPLNIAKIIDITFKPADKVSKTQPTQPEDDSEDTNNENNNSN